MKLFCVVLAYSYLCPINRAKVLTLENAQIKFGILLAYSYLCTQKKKYINDEEIFCVGTNRTGYGFVR